MATYLANPDYQVHQFTPYIPPYQGALQAIQAKTQYWLEGASKIKSAFDNVISKDYTREDSKAKINQFRQEVEPQLETIAKKDLSIGSYQKQALNLMTPITRDRGLLIDENTTELANNVMKAAQQDATKNGGKYYNQYSVQYANQIKERYKNASSAEDMQYLETLQQNPYMPYDPKAADNIHTRVKTLMEQTKTYDIRQDDGTMKRVTEPRYSITEALNILKETASPQEKSLLDLMGKVQFNGYQLATQNNPQELQKLGATYKAQINATFNEKIEFQTQRKATLEAELNSLDDNDPLKKTKKSNLEQSISSLDGEIKDLISQRDGIKAEYFSDPSMWKMGEQYATVLYNQQHYRNLAVSLSPELGYKIVADPVYDTNMRYKAATEKAAAKAREQAAAEAADFQNPTLANLTVDDLGDPKEKASTIKTYLSTLGNEENRAFGSSLLTALDITAVDDNDQRQDLSTLMQSKDGNDQLSDILTGITTEGRKNLEQLIKASGRTDIPSDIGSMTIAQTRQVINEMMGDKTKVLDIARKAGFNNGSIDMISDLYTQKNDIDNKIELTKSKYAKVYKNVFKDFIPEAELNKLSTEELFKFESKEVLTKVLAPQLQQIAKTYNLNPQQTSLIIDYIRGDKNAQSKLEAILPKSAIKYDPRKSIGRLDKFDRMGASQEEIDILSSPVFEAITPIKDLYDRAKGQLTTALEDQLTKDNGQLGFQVVQKVFNVTDNYKEGKTRNNFITTQEIKNFIDQGSAVFEDGTVKDNNQRKFDFIKNNLNNGILQYVLSTTFRNAPGVQPWMEITFDVDKMKKAVKDGSLNVTKDGWIWGDTELEQTQQKAAKIFFTNPELSTDLQQRITQVSDEVEQFVTQKPKDYSLLSGGNLQVVNRGVNGFDIHFTGDIMRAEMLQNGQLKIGKMNISKNDNYENISMLLSANANPNMFNDLRQRTAGKPEIRKIVSSVSRIDARATVLQQEIEANKEKLTSYIKEENGEILLNLPALEKAQPELYNKLIRIISQGKY